MKKKEPFVDDGRVIANMDIEGMPWNTDKSLLLGGMLPKKKKIIDSENNDINKNNSLDLTKKEMRTIVLNSFFATLSIVMIFIICGFLFILFCTSFLK